MTPAFSAKSPNGPMRCSTCGRTCLKLYLAFPPGTDVEDADLVCPACALKRPDDVTHTFGIVSARAKAIFRRELQHEARLLRSHARRVRRSHRR